MSSVQIKYQGRLPTRATLGAAGHDLRASCEVRLEPGYIERVPTGLWLEVPEGYEAQIRPRSGLAVEGVHVHWATIDSDYRGQICVIMHSLRPYRVYEGHRIAQLVIAPVIPVTWTFSTALSETSREDGGFGSTGR